MPDKYTKMDAWSSEDVATFKQETRNQSLAQAAEAIAPLGVEPLAAPAPGGIGPIVAEGDSWFDYLPGTDLIDCLRRFHGYTIDNYAKAGDTLENMIFGTNINLRFERISPTIDTVLRQIGSLQPKIFLFSGGGNDVAGEEFESYLNHKQSGLPNLRISHIDNMIDHVFRRYYESLIDRVASVAPNTHILAHGYGNTMPTGKGVNVFLFNFAGPWLRPALAKKGIMDQTEQLACVSTLIDRFNGLLADLDNSHSMFHHVDLRGEIDPVADWANELHLVNSAYARCADRIDGVIRSL